MDTHVAPEQTQHHAIACDPPIWQLFRDVIADRLPDRMPFQAAMLFGSEIDPDWDDRAFLAEFCSEILHQDTCQPYTADGRVLLVALAVDDRIPARHRFQAVDLLFQSATVAERHLAETWPATPQHADPDSEARARNAVQLHTPDLLARWPAECPAVRMALAWTWWGSSQSPRTCGAVARHQLQEIAMHTYDAQLTVGAPKPLPEEVAFDGVEEFLFTCCTTTVACPHKPAVVDYHVTEGGSWRQSVSADGSRVSTLCESCPPRAPGKLTPGCPALRFLKIKFAVGTLRRSAVVPSAAAGGTGGDKGGCGPGARLVRSRDGQGAAASSPGSGTSAAMRRTGRPMTAAPTRTAGAGPRRR